MALRRLIGRRVMEWALDAASVLRMIAFSVGYTLLRPGHGRRAVRSVILRQIYFTGFEAIPVISWIALILGLVIVTQVLNIMPKVGRESLIGTALVWVVIRELGPVFASVIVIARSGTAIASELGSMKVSSEITALEAMGIDPRRYLAAPRVIGTGISVFILTFYFEVITILGGYLLAGFGKNVAFSVYMGSILEALGLVEIGVSLLKSLFFGLIIGAVCVCRGLRAEKSITRIPQETTKAVIGSLRLVFVTDAVITFLFFM